MPRTLFGADGRTRKAGAEREYRSIRVVAYWTERGAWSLGLLRRVYTDCDRENGDSRRGEFCHSNFGAADLLMNMNSVPAGRGKWREKISHAKPAVDCLIPLPSISTLPKLVQPQTGRKEDSKKHQRTEKQAQDPTSLSKPISFTFKTTVQVVEELVNSLHSICAQ